MKAYLKKTRRVEAHTVKQLCTCLSVQILCNEARCLSSAHTCHMRGKKQAQNRWRENRDASENLFFLPSLVVTMVFWRICIITVLLHTPWLWLTMVMVAKPWLICGYHSFLVSCVVKPWSISVRGGRLFIASLGLIYETNVRPKFGHMVVSTQNLEFINMDVSGGYDQISRQVWARVRKFLS